jgi:hypothetical protein
MSTPKISFKVPSAEPAGPSEDAEIAGGDVSSHDLSSAPGKEREREPVFGGDIANISNNPNDSESMDVDGANGGMYSCQGRGWAWMRMRLVVACMLYPSEQNPTNNNQCNVCGSENAYHTLKNNPSLA